MIPIGFLIRCLWDFYGIQLSCPTGAVCVFFFTCSCTAALEPWQNSRDPTLLLGLGDQGFFRVPYEFGNPLSILYPLLRLQHPIGDRPCWWLVWWTSLLPQYTTNQHWWCHKNADFFWSMAWGCRDDITYINTESIFWYILYLLGMMKYFGQYFGDIQTVTLW